VDTDRNRRRLAPGVSWRQGGHDEPGREPSPAVPRSTLAPSIKRRSRRSRVTADRRELRGKGAALGVRLHRAVLGTAP